MFWPRRSDSFDTGYVPTSSQIHYPYLARVNNTKIYLEHWSFLLLYFSGEFVCECCSLLKSCNTCKLRWTKHITVHWLSESPRGMSNSKPIFVVIGMSCCVKPATNKSLQCCFNVGLHWTPGLSVLQWYPVLMPPTCSVAVLWISIGQEFSESSGCSVETQQLQLTVSPAAQHIIVKHKEVAHKESSFHRILSTQSADSLFFFFICKASSGFTHFTCYQ